MQIDGYLGVGEDEDDIPVKQSVHRPDGADQAILPHLGDFLGLFPVQPGVGGHYPDGGVGFSETLTHLALAHEHHPVGKAGPEVEVMALAPAQEAPTTAAIEASSSSICMYTPPTWGSRKAMRSATSVAGVIG